MNVANKSSAVYGANIAALDKEASLGWLAWLTGCGEAPGNKYDVSFALAHSDAGVTWGYLDDERKWKLGNEVDPSLCPIPTEQSLHELRVFGKTTEVLIWRTDDGLRGRVLIDNSNAIDDNDPLAPFRESRRLRGDKKETKDAFICYVDRGGAQHLPPSRFPEEFSVCHYLQEETETGAVRIVATRLVPEKKS